MWALHCGAQAPEHAGSVVVARGLSSCGARGLEHAGTVVAARRLTCSAACGILVPPPGIEPCPLHWKVDSFFFF